MSNLYVSTYHVYKIVEYVLNLYGVLYKTDVKPLHVLYLLKIIQIKKLGTVANHLKWMN